MKYEADIFQDEADLQLWCYDEKGGFFPPFFAFFKLRG